jgi:tetratricopeptide (TPR) repeat protein
MCVEVAGQQPDTAAYISTKPSAERPINANNETQLAQQYYRNQEYEKAVLLYERFYRENPSYVNYTYYLYCLVQLNEFNEAEKLVRKQMRLNPGKPRYLVDLGYVYQMSDEPGKAKKEYEDALMMLPADRNAIVELAGAFQSRRETGYAIRTYQRGRELLQYTEPFHLELGQIYEIEGRYEEMFDEYLDMIEFDITRLQIVQARLQNSLSDDPDGSKNDLFRITLLKRVQAFPDNTLYSELLIWFSIQQKEFETALLQAKALDRRFGEEGERVYSIALLAASNQEYDVAIDAYNYIIRKGPSTYFYVTGRVELLNVNFQKMTDGYAIEPAALASLEQQYLSTLTEFGQSPQTLSMIRNLAHLQAFYLGKTTEGASLLTGAIKMNSINPQQRAECKLELADILLFSGEPWEATLLYSQVEKEFKHEPIGHEAKFRNARLSYYIGEFAWAKAQLDVLKAATSKLIANDAMELSLLISDNMDYDSTYGALSVFSKADLYLFRNETDRAEALLDSLLIQYSYHPIADEVLFKKAELAMKKGHFQEADTLLQQVVTTYPYEILADNALFMQATLYEEQFQDAEKAMQLYQRLMGDYPGSLFVVEARKRFRHLRGDVVN